MRKNNDSVQTGTALVSVLGRSQWKQMTERPCFVQCAGIAWPRKQSLAIGTHIRKFFRNDITPVGVEEGRGGGTVGEAETIADDPFPAFHVLIQKPVGGVEHRSPAMAAIIVFTAKSREDKALQRVVNIII